MAVSRRSFILGGGAFLVAQFTVGCGGAAHDTGSTLDGYLERFGAILDEREADGRRGRVVVGWKGLSLHFPRAHEKLRDGDEVFLIQVHGRYVEQFLEDVDASGVELVDVQVYQYRANKNVRHDEP